MASTATHGRQADGRSPRRRRPGVLTTLGILLLVAGLSILGWAGWQYYGTNITSRHEARSATSQIESRWASEKKSTGKSSSSSSSAPAVPTGIGDGMALVRIPDLGSSWEYPLFAGTTPDVLAKGIGWYTSTAQPGQVGNFAVAAHRVTHGEPFRHLLDLQKGAKVIVETRDAVYTYELDQPAGKLTVQDTEGWVLDPVPGKPSQKPTRALITLTTCQDLFHSPDRSVAFGHLVSTSKK